MQSLSHCLSHILPPEKNLRGLHCIYTRRQLLGLRCVPGSKSKVYVNEVAIHGLLRYRGNRAGRVTHRRQDRASVCKHDPDRQPGSIQTVHSRLKAQPTQQSRIPVVTARRSATTRYRRRRHLVPRHCVRCRSVDRPSSASVRCDPIHRPLLHYLSSTPCLQHRPYMS